MKRVAPAAVLALKEALAKIYWYKSDLRSFLTNALTESAILARLNWSDYKVNIVGSLIDRLAGNQSVHMADLLRLMTEVARLDDFSHLERLEDGRRKADEASRAVAALRSLVSPHQDLLDEQERAEERRRAVREELLSKQTVRQKLEELLAQLLEVISPAGPQERGFSLERTMRELFELFDLDPKASFRVAGEQIDGAFSFEGTDYLFEARWQSNPGDAADLDTFQGKISRKLENTLGLFLSINGFSTGAIEAHSGARPVMFLMDGADLMAVLEGRIDLIELLLRKRRHAAQTDQIHLPIHSILT